MQIRKTHRIFAALLVFAMVVGLLPVSAFARANGDDGSAEMNEAYAAHESLMPIGPSFNVDTLLEWTPESDPDAAYSRSSIPMADRVGGFVVNPLANPEAKLMLCSTPNLDHDNASAQGTNEFFTYAFNYWQYADSFVYWSGSEEGLVVCPTGEFIDAAHTNGVPIVATLGFPWGSGAGYVEQVRKFVQKSADGSFPVADKLIEVMDYYGFDGYFFNQESYGCSKAEADLIDEMMRYMHKKRPDMLISWYDSMLPTGGVSYQNAVTSANSAFMKDSEDGTRAIDEFFMNYNWYESQVSTTISTMKSIGRSQFDAFAGFNVQANVYGDRLNDHLLIDEDGLARLSLALYYAGQTLSLAKTGEEFHETERGYYVNAAGDPRVNDVDVANSAVRDWAGMSRFFADKSPIVKAPFVTNFNTGHGKALFVNGELSREGEWSYQSNQDVLPTWTWIIDSEGEKLSGGYDFTTAYNGGNSIKFTGNLTANKANDIMLFSTKLLVEAGMKLGLTYKGDQGILKLVAYYGDAGTESYEACEKMEFLLSDSEGEWTSVEASLTSLAGKTLYAVGLKIEAEEDITGYQLNLGRLTITEKARAALNGPAKVTLDEIMYKDAFTAEARVFWTPVTGASSYEIYKVNADGSKTLIMETPNTAYYIAELNRESGETDIKLEVVAINRNGVRGTKGTELVVAWPYGDEDTEKIDLSDFENVCLGATVTGYSEQGDGAECDKAIDGSYSSKWWASNRSGQYMTIDLGRECTIKRWLVGHGGSGGEGSGMNHRSFGLQYKNAAGQWVECKRIENNSLDITDVLLDEPITAREWKLIIYQCGTSPWTAVNIYEWQMFESDQYPQSAPVPMHFASAVNGEGANDTFTLRNVPEGRTVHVYTKTGDTYTMIGEKAAAGTVEFTGLDFGTAEAGRIYYSTTASGTESAKLSVAFEAETAEKSAIAENVSFEKYSHIGSSTSSNGSDIYTTLTVNGLAAGDMVYVYGNGSDVGYTKASVAVAEGETSVSIDGVLVNRAGGTLNLQVKRSGKLISDIYTVNTPAFDAPTGTIRLFAYNANGESLTGVSYGVYNEADEMVAQISTTSDSGGSATVALGTYTLKCMSVPSGYVKNDAEVLKIMRIENWTYDVNVQIEAGASTGVVTGVAIAPETASVEVGETQAFTATVTGTGEYDETIIWSISGNTSAATTISGEGVLTVGADESATTLTVTATSNADPTKSATAIVHVEKSPEHLFEEAREAAKKELEDYKAALLAENAYSENGEAALADALSAGIAALEEAGTEEALAAALAEAKAAMDAVPTAAEEGDLEAAVKAAQAAQKAAEEAAQRAEEAKAAAEAAQAAAEEAAASTAEDKAAAEAAAAEAEAAAQRAEEAIAAAEAAQAAAEAAAQAAEESNAAAALEAQKAAEEAAKSATSAAEAAQYAAEAAEAQQGAQEAREAAEAAQAAAEEAQRKAEEAQAAAEEAAASSAEDKEAAENAKKEAEAAQKAAEDAKKAAEDAEAAAKAAEESAAAHDAAAAKAAAEAARYAQEVAEKYEEICAMKAEMAEYLLDAQKAAEAAEEAKKKAEAAELNCAKYYAMFTLATYADKKDYAEAQQAELAAAIEAGTKAIEAAESIDAVNEALAAAKAAIDAIKTLADLEAEKLPFTDVTENDWFFNAVKYAYQNGIMVGDTTTTFNPHGTLKRGQLVAMLYRMAGAPEVSEKSPFTDVPEGMYYADAIAWAYENEIAYGKSATTFDPTAEVTREEMAAFLARFAKFQGVYEEADEKVLEKYEDVESIQDYAVPYIAWAVENGIMSGMSESVMAPTGTAKRCQAANLMMNYQLAFVDAE